MYVVIVFFDLSANAFEAFRAAIVRNAARSRDEPGCRQFDVCFSEDRSRCFLYERYDDPAAFAAHRTTAHFQEFDRISKPLYSRKTVETFLQDRG
jgi:(4S)-4-hydroxy-5-phosphonooxypentane-2,3-dione isomerase